MSDKIVARILHISDLHAGSDSNWWTSGSQDRTEYKKLTNGKHAHDIILECLQKYHGKDFDLIAVTGDFANEGYHQEFEVTRLFLGGLKEGLVCKRATNNEPYLMVVPGNHDITRSALEKLEADKHPIRSDCKKCYDKKFSEFNKMLHHIVPGPEHVNAFSYDQQFDLERHIPQLDEDGKPKFPDDKQWCAIGLNSAIQESHRVKDHYGKVPLNQLDEVKKKCLLGFSPWEFRMAILHHNPIVMPYGLNPALDTIEPAAKIIKKLCSDLNQRNDALKPCNELKKTGNFLWNTSELLDELAKMGVQLVLAGHYHISEPQHYIFPHPDDAEQNPFGHGGITVLRAPSFTKGLQPGFQVIEVYQGNFRFNIKLYSYKFELNNGEFYDYQPTSTRPYQFSCHSNRPMAIIDGLVGLLSESSQPSRDKGTENNLYCGVRLDCSPDKICLHPPDDEHRPLKFLESFDGWSEQDLNEDIQRVMWQQLRVNVLKNASIYADLPHWSLYSIKECLKNSEYDYECYFSKSYFLHYHLLSLGLRYPYLKSKEDNRSVSFREKYFLPSIHQERYSKRNITNLDDYLKSHRYLGLRTTLQVLFYVPDWGQDGAILLKVRSPHVAHFPNQIQLPVGGGFKSVLFEKEGIGDLQKVVREETKFETGITLPIDRCIALTINTRTFCPAFTFLMEIQKEDFDKFFIKIKNRNIFSDHKEQKTLERYVPKLLPRDWWEGQFLTPYKLQERPRKQGYEKFVLLMKAVDNFFTNNDVRSKLDEYVGSSIELYKSI